MNSNIQSCFETTTFKRRKYNEVLKNMFLSYTYISCTNTEVVCKKESSPVSLPFYSGIGAPFQEEAMEKLTQIDESDLRETI